MGFWDARLKPAAPAPGQVLTAPPATAQAPWWDQNRISGLPAYAPGAQAAQQAQQIPQEQGSWGTIEGSLARAKSARLNETCPECGSGNYGRPIGMKKAMAQCQACGYNERFGLQAGSGAVSKDVGAAKPSVQVMGKGWDTSTWLEDYETGVMSRIDSL